MKVLSSEMQLCNFSQLDIVRDMSSPSSRFGPWQCGFLGDALRGAGPQLAFHRSASTLIHSSPWYFENSLDSNELHTEGQESPWFTSNHLSDVIVSVIICASLIPEPSSHQNPSCTASYSALNLLCEMSNRFFLELNQAAVDVNAKTRWTGKEPNVWGKVKFRLLRPHDHPEMVG